MVYDGYWVSDKQFGDEASVGQIFFHFLLAIAGQEGQLVATRLPKSIAARAWCNRLQGTAILSATIDGPDLKGA